MNATDASAPPPELLDDAPSPLIEHLHREWKAKGWPTEEQPEVPVDHPHWDAMANNNMRVLVFQNLLELMETFCGQGHSGSSAPYVVDLFAKLALYKPLSPLTGADDEWLDNGGDDLQNVRASHVFKNKATGAAYDIRGRVFRHPDGACFTSADSRVPVTFPYTPNAEYVDVDEAAS